MVRGRLVFLVLTTVVLSLAVACGGDGEKNGPGCEVGEPGCPEVALTGDPAEDLARKYAPVLYLREQEGPCDHAGGAYIPRPVELVLGNPEVALRHGNGTLIKNAPLAADLYEAGEGTYLDLPGNPRRPGCRYENDYRRFSEGMPALAYVHIVPSPDAGEISVQYWFFYYFNHWNNKHEGDWERIQLTFEADSIEEALAVEPERIGLSGHRGGEIGLWTDEKVAREGTRPIIYVAAGSNANFFGSHVYVGRAESNAGLGCDDTSAPHQRVPLEVQLVPSAVEDADDPYAWAFYQGRWGELAGPEFSGPTGPAAKDQWYEPLEWEDGLRNSTVYVPAHNAIGPDAVGAFCDFIGFTTDFFLPVFLELPLVSVVAAVGLVAGAAVSLTKTRYRPAESVPLQRRRRLGQILTSASRLYRQHAGLFLGIGLVFIPATVLVSGVHWLVLEISPVDGIVPIPTNNVWQELVVVVALAELQFGVAYALVFAASTIAVADINAGRPAGVVGSFLELWHRFAQLALPRLLAVGVVMVLALTIIGLPLALWLALRWSFLEQAAILADRPGRAAFRESAETVAKDWWWAAGATVALVAVGVLAAPALGIILILAWTSLSLAAINLIISLVYMALVPYVAISLAMVYFDLKLRGPRTGATAPQRQDSSPQPSV